MKKKRLTVAKQRIKFKKWYQEQLNLLWRYKSPFNINQSYKDDEYFSIDLFEMGEIVCNIYNITSRKFEEDIVRSVMIEEWIPTCGMSSIERMKEAYEQKDLFTLGYLLSGLFLEPLYTSEVESIIEHLEEKGKDIVWLYKKNFRHPYQRALRLADKIDQITQADAEADAQARAEYDAKCAVA